MRIDRRNSRREFSCKPSLVDDIAYAVGDGGLVRRMRCAEGELDPGSALVDCEITEDTNGDDIRSELRIVDGAKAITQVGFGGGVCRYCGSVP